MFIRMFDPILRDDLLLKTRAGIHMNCISYASRYRSRTAYLAVIDCMVSRYKSLYPLFAAPLFIAFLIWAHAVAPEDYQPMSQGISSLGAQGYTHNWVLRLGLFTFGGIVMLGVILNGIRGRTLPIFIFALFLTVTGVFSAAPWTDELYYSGFSAAMNGMFSQLADWTLVAAIFVQGIHSGKPEIRKIHYLFFGVALAMALGAWFLPDFKGLLQRILWAIGLNWLVLHFRPRGV